MGNVVPVDEFTGEWYPGYKPEHFDFPYWVDGPEPVPAGRRERLLVPRLPLVARPHPARRHPVERRRLLLGHPERVGEAAAARPAAA